MDIVDIGIKYRHNDIIDIGLKYAQIRYNRYRCKIQT